MSVLYIVVPLALLLGGLAVAAFIWSVRRGEFDDLDTPAARMLADDTPIAAQGMLAQSHVVGRSAAVEHGGGSDSGGSDPGGSDSGGSDSGGSDSSRSD